MEKINSVKLKLCGRIYYVYIIYNRYIVLRVNKYVILTSQVVCLVRGALRGKEKKHINGCNKASS